MGFRKLIYENVEKKHSFHNKRIYIYGSKTFWSLMKFYFVNIVKVCFFVFKNSHYAHIPLYIYVIHSQQWEMRKNNSKWNFTINRWASWFSCGRPKISKCSVSLAQLGECSKSKVILLWHVNIFQNGLILNFTDILT